MSERAGCMVIDADGHVIERPEMWTEYVEGSLYFASNLNVDLASRSGLLPKKPADRFQGALKAIAPAQGGLRAGWRRLHETRARPLVAPARSGRDRLTDRRAALRLP